MSFCFLTNSTVLDDFPHVSLQLWPVVTVGDQRDCLVTSQVAAQSTTMKFPHDFLSQGPLWNAHLLALNKKPPCIRKPLTFWWVLHLFNTSLKSSSLMYCSFRVLKPVISVSTATNSLIFCNIFLKIYVM